jgi:hypothetical protein
LLCREKNRGRAAEASALAGGPVKSSRALLFASVVILISVPGGLHASTDALEPDTVSFAYRHSHPVKALPDAVIDSVAGPKPDDESVLDKDTHPLEPPVALGVAPARHLTRDSVCTAIVSAARANDLPIPFFANLIWQESNFRSSTVSPAGAQGIAQFMPQTAREFGLVNPFEPIQALFTAGKFLRQLASQFGNLGLAAAAYNAGPKRVADWLGRRASLPGETRDYVRKITGRPADAWTSRAFVQAPEAAVMPARAPCWAVADEVEAQTRAAQAAKLLADLDAKASSHAEPAVIAAAGKAAWKLAIAKANWRRRTLVLVQEMRALAERHSGKLSARLASRSKGPTKKAPVAVAKADVAAKSRKLAGARAHPQRAHYASAH